MAHDDRYERERGGSGGRETQWRGDNSFGGGWGNQTPRPTRLGDRNARGESDDPEHGLERYGGGAASGYGGGGGFGPTTDPDSFFSAPGYDAEFGGPRFDRADVGSTGTHGVHPVSSSIGGDYQGAAGVMPGGGWSSSARRYAQIERAQGQQQQQGGSQQQSQHDPHYAEWRRRQAEQLDRDYHDYCRENEGRFEREFGEWRERRGQQRQALGRASEHMEVVGSDGAHVGTVDATRDDAIILTKNDPSAGGHHHSIPCAWVETVDDKVRLNIPADEAMRRWEDVERSGAMFDRDRGEGEGEGPHILNRSFSGTYRDRDER